MLTRVLTDMISSIVECRISGHKNLKRSKMLKATSRSFSEASLRQIANFDVHIKNWFESTTLKFLTHEFYVYLVLFFSCFFCFENVFEYWVLLSRAVGTRGRGAIASLDFDRFGKFTYRLFFLRLIALAWIVLSVHKMNKLVNSGKFMDIAEYHVKLRLI